MSGKERYNGAGDPTPPPVRTDFFTICIGYNLGHEAFQSIADIAGVSKDTVETMFIGTAVQRADAEKVLVALTQLTGQVWNLTNVKVPLIDEEVQHD